MNGAPAPQDKPTTLPLLDEVLSLAPALEAEWPAIRSTIPAGTLLNEGEGEETGEEPGGDTTADTGPEDTGQPAGGEPESFFDFDPSQVPDNADREWLANQYGEMRKAFTQKTMGLAEERRNAEEQQALIEGLRDPETRPHYLRLLGVDVTDPEQLRQLGVDVASATDELDDLLDEPDPEERIGQLEQRLEQEAQQRQQAEELQVLDGLAEEELTAIEKQWDRKLTPDEDAILRREAESNPGPDGLPDYARAAKLLKGILNSGVEHELKRRQEGGGRGGPGGKPGGKAPDLSTEDGRLAAAEAAAARAMASQQ